MPSGRHWGLVRSKVVKPSPSRRNLLLPPFIFWAQMQRIKYVIVVNLSAWISHATLVCRCRAPGTSNRVNSKYYWRSRWIDGREDEGMFTWRPLELLSYRDSSQKQSQRQMNKIWLNSWPEPDKKTPKCLETKMKRSSIYPIDGITMCITQSPVRSTVQKVGNHETHIN